MSFLLALVLAASALLVHAEHPAVPLSREARGVSDQSVSFGSLNPYDRVLASKTVYKSSSFLSVHEEKLTMTVSTGVITHVKVDDLLKNGKNAEVKVKSGGPGHKDVTLKFTSKRGGKINYNVTLYGR